MGIGPLKRYPMAGWPSIAQWGLSATVVFALGAIHEHLPPQARKGTEGGGMDEGFGTSEDRAPGRSGFRLCNLIAQDA